MTNTSSGDLPLMSTTISSSVPAGISASPGATFRMRVRVATAAFERESGRRRLIDFGLMTTYRHSRTTIANSVPPSRINQLRSIA